MPVDSPRQQQAPPASPCSPTEPGGGAGVLPPAPLASPRATPKGAGAAVRGGLCSPGGRRPVALPSPGGAPGRPSRLRRRDRAQLGCCVILSVSLPPLFPSLGATQQVGGRPTAAWNWGSSGRFQPPSKFAKGPPGSAGGAPQFAPKFLPSCRLPGAGSFRPTQELAGNPAS